MGYKPNGNHAVELFLAEGQSAMPPNPFGTEKKQRIYSSYYEKSFGLSKEEQEILLDLYEEICREGGFAPDYGDRGLVDFSTDTSLFNTVLYHVECFGRNKEQYQKIAHLFE